MSKIELIESLDNLDKAGVNYSEIEKNSYLDPTKWDEPLKPCLSIGTYFYRGKPTPIHFGSYGDFSCIVGPSKSRKTFFKTALTSCYLGGRSNWYFPDIKGHNEDSRYVIDLDTEQNRIHARYVSNRVREMVGSKDIPLYRSYALRKYDVSERKGFMEWLCNDSKYSGKIGLMFVDGAADMVTNVNDLDASNELVSSFMKLTEVHNMHICTILHKNSGGEKPTGHLGSAILKKAETVAYLELDGQFTKVEAKYTRNKEFEPFKFTLNNDYLPIEYTAYQDSIQDSIEKDDDEPF